MAKKNETTPRTIKLLKEMGFVPHRAEQYIPHKTPGKWRGGHYADKYGIIDVEYLDVSRCAEISIQACTKDDKWRHLKKIQEHADVIRMLWKCHKIFELWVWGKVKINPMKTRTRWELCEIIIITEEALTGGKP
jgi:hypothetical protein